MESSNQLSLQQFIANQQEVGIPQNFIEIYIANKDLNGHWIHSELAFEWLKDEYTRYDHFIRAIKNYPEDLWKSHDIQFENITPQQRGARQHGGNNKKFYLISSELYKMLAMKNINKRMYYVKLEQLVNQYEDYQRQCQQEQLQQRELQHEEEKKQLLEKLEEYQTLKKVGSIYEIYNIDDPSQNYYGSHNNTIIEERWSTHVQSALSSLKLPLYRQIFRKGLEHFRQRLVTEVEYISKEQLEEIEKGLIDQNQPSLNGNIISQVCTGCRQAFKRIQQHKCKSQ